MRDGAVITVDGLVFDYPGKRALRGVDIAVPRGAVLALVGPNGAGKSTLMRVIAGLDEPVEGRVQVCGISVLDEPRQAQRHLGYLSDFFGLYDELTVRQCLVHAASVRAMRGASAQAAVTQAARRVGLADRLDVRAGALSRGLRQRLAIAQAIVHSPDVILLDEPASGLDPEARASLSGLFRELRAQGHTLVVSSHILAELEEYSTHMLAIRDGRVSDFVELGGHVQAGVQRLRIRLAGAWQSPPGFWEAQGAGLRDRGDPLLLTVDMPGQDAGAARLLKALVEAGAPVAECTVMRESLQDTYLRSARVPEGSPA
ncbi:ABC transporter ATP-binding protein [Ramlibacter algicola]|uniref:ABC transporter ATP-binding protein n=1 Tax=Ramlibacter algicola TaxID=2795217 RepID=A0A934PXV3_9BURK|nr:ABC transporter ATP-binding protein [Ramlibacter algicola]MBK0392494.1 ABC transporter ATP-binding protein [Ramlibacter algicola]